MLSILTSSEKVARALNMDIAALQNSLRPLQVQVQEIAVDPSYAASGQDLSFMGQNFGFSQQYYSQNGNALYQMESMSDSAQDLIVQNDILMTQYIEGAGLNTYI